LLFMVVVTSKTKKEANCFPKRGPIQASVLALSSGVSDPVSLKEKSLWAISP